MNKKEFFYLDKIVTPKIILWGYWLSIVITFFGGVSTMFSDDMGLFSFARGIFVIVFGLIALRVAVEILLILFKIEAHLKKIAEANIEIIAQSETEQ